MADLERTYNVPLREGTQLAPAYRRAKKAVRVLRAFIEKHMKCEDVRIGPYLNEFIWKRGIKSPPHHVEVKATKTTKKEDNKETTTVFVELVTLPKKAQKVEKKKSEQKQIAEKKKRKAPAKEETSEPQAEDSAKEAEAPKKKVVRKVAKKEE